KVAPIASGSAEVSAAIDARIVAVPDNKVEDLYASVIPLQAQQARLWRQSARRWRGMVMATIALGIAEAIAITALLPAQKIQPVFLYLDKFGLQQTATSVSDLPVDHRVAGIDALLWQYL